MSSQLLCTVPGERLWQEGAMNFPTGFNVSNSELAWAAEAS